MDIENTEKEPKPRRFRIVLDMVEGSETVRMLKEVKEHKGYARYPAVFMDALTTLHRKTFPGSYYGTKSKNMEEESVEETELRKIAQKAEKEAVSDKILHGQKVANAKRLFGAQVRRNPDTGTWRVLYKTYSGKASYPREIALDAVTDDTVKNQFYPSEQKVRELQPEEFPIVVEEKNHEPT